MLTVGQKTTGNVLKNAGSQIVCMDCPVYFWDQRILGFFHSNLSPLCRHNKIVEYMGGMTNFHQLLRTTTCTEQKPPTLPLRPDLLRPSSNLSSNNLQAHLIHLYLQPCLPRNLRKVRALVPPKYINSLITAQTCTNLNPTDTCEELNPRRADGYRLLPSEPFK